MSLYPQFPRDKFRVRVHHYPEVGLNNGKKRYITTAALHLPNCPFSFPLVEVCAICNPIDQPSRKEGYKLAIERLTKAAIGMGLIEG